MPQPSPTKPARRAGSSSAAALRALGSFVVLVALLIGLPLLLWWATAVVGPDGVRALGNLASTRDSGQVFLLALAAIGWVGWAGFAGSVLLEIPAQLRGRSAPQLRGLLGQRTAATLVGALFLVLPAGTAPAAPAAPAAHAATPAAATAPPGSAKELAAASTTASPQSSTPTVVSYTVQEVRPAESLWTIAQQQLGDGNRWQEIADLNTGRTMADGTTFRADAPIQPGWVLRLPSDAHAQDTSISSANGEPAGPHATYTVAPGDSLSSIAQQQLGDDAKWPDIYALNKGQEQPGGRHLTDPDLIYPQEHLQLPSTAPSKQEPPATHEAPQHQAPSPAIPPPATAPPAGTAPSTTPPASTAPAVTPTQQPGTAPTPAHTPATAAETGSTTTAHTTATGSRMPLYALGGGLLAAAVLTMLGLRRRHQQRRRGISRRIPLPTGSAAATEQALRATEHPDVPQFIDSALRTAAIGLAAASQELPDLSAVVYDGHGLELRLAEPTPPVAPFTAVDGDLARWRCSIDSNELLPAEHTDTIEAPYPALVTLGSTATSTVLVDLEHYGLVTLTGPHRRAVLRALAIELATSRYAEHLDIAVAGATTCPGLPPLVPEWVTAYDTVDAAMRAAQDHHAMQARALADLGVDGLRGARLRDDQASSWTPCLVLADEPGNISAAALATLAGQLPHTAGAVITAAASPVDLPAGGWHLDSSDGQVRLPDHDLTVTLQVLPDDDYSDLVAILAASDDSRPDVPSAPSTPVPGSRPADEPPVAPPAPAPTEPAPAPYDPAGHTDVEEVRSLQVELTKASHEDDTGAPAALLAGFADLDDPDDLDDVPSPDLANPRPPATESIADPETTTAAPSAAVPAPAPPVEAIEPITPTAQTTATAPLIRILGPVDITGTQGTTDTKYLRVVTEIAAWMVLHPGLDHRALDEAIWPGRDVSRKTRNPWISRLRTLLGAAADGTKYLPAIATTNDARYRLADPVTSDWHLFQNLVAKGTTSTGDAADDRLRAALDLVRGRPFAAVPPRRYVWAEHLAQDMISAIVDVAATLGERRLATADPRGALWATTKGLNVAPEAEHLYRINFRAHHALGDHEGLERAAGQLERLCDDLGSDMEDATVELLRSLLTAAAPLR
ncbi:LysM domain-containing protein [Actinacidiphila yanglinensis]|uniref:LysM domain-containing protein n=1 Tax=Actinacidiphila yanglinensis TaxID=310779 RepID=A0A1H6DL55_9ACTN|nr:LysM peptidoglycan-binding domain-containing protein [Actinacidiphila yanglinensis]SEG85871.1 LysM domain-containing protein [Actinacidiphila yanglinensis]